MIRSITFFSRVILHHYYGKASGHILYYTQSLIYEKVVEWYSSTIHQVMDHLAKECHVQECPITDRSDEKKIFPNLQPSSMIPY